MGSFSSFKMLGLACILVASMALGGNAVAPLSPDELKQIRDFTTKAHMKRLQSYPDQLMTPSTHYLGRRLPSPSAGEKQPTIFMEAPSNTNTATVTKPPTFQIQQQPIQNYLVNYPVTANSINQVQSQNAPVFQQRPQQAAPLQFVPVQNSGHLRGPPPPLYKRPPFFSFGGPESSPPSSLFQFFFPKRPARRPPTYRTPIRFEYAQTAPNPAIVQHHQNLHKVMAQQHLLAVQQQHQQQQQQVAVAPQTVAQPSISTLTAQSTTIKSTVGNATPTVAAPSTAAQTTGKAAVTSGPAPILYQNIQGQHGFIPGHSHGPLFNLNQFHREVQFFGKPVGKPIPPQKFSPYPKGQAFLTQTRPGDEINYIQKYAAPQHEFTFLPHGPHLPPVISGPTSNRFASPVSFSHMEQMPFGVSQPQQLPMPLVVQSQEFPHYHFTTTFTATNNNNGPTKAATPSVTPTVIINTQVGDAPIPAQDVPAAHNHAASVQTTRTQRVKKLRPRTTTPIPTTTTTYSPIPTTTQSLGDVIFESAKETREFHDSAHISPPTISHLDTVVVKPRKVKKQQIHQHHTEVEGSLPKASVESSVVVAPSSFTSETQEPLISTSSPRPITSTLVSVSTISTTTQEPVKPKLIKSGHKKHHHHHHQEKKVTASGAGLGAVTVEPMRLTSTGSSTTLSTSSSSSSKSTLSPGGRVVTTSITSRVVSTGAANPQKRYRLRKVKVPNPDAVKTGNRSTTTLSSLAPSSSSSSYSTSNLPSSTTPLSTRIPRSTTTASATESSSSSSTTTA